MSAVIGTKEGSPPSHPPKPLRILACTLCQQRKIRCDRKYPCSHCIKSQTQCVPATQVSRQRKRKFPERELLERLRKYEDLLRENNIDFDPLYQNLAGYKESPNVEDVPSLDEEQSKLIDRVGSPSTTVNSEKIYEAKNMRHTMNRQFQDSDNTSNFSDSGAPEVAIKNVWNDLFESNDHLLFGSRKTAVDISTLHPEPVQIFRLWQLYLENVDPLLKVTHTPSLQGRIIEAASNISGIKPSLEALMFSIYCMSIVSLTGDDCQTIFGSSKVDLLTKYQIGCQEALLNSGFLRCGDLDCLIALYLYLISVRPSTVPQSLSSMLGVAFRIAQRIGIHNESALAKCSALEAEMRRRLWWSLVLFDTRIAELAGSKSVTLTPTWDCRIPLNVNDGDLRLEMKNPPQIQGISTEALFIVVRSDMANFVRNTMYQFDLTSPALKTIAVGPEGSKLARFGTMVEDKYLKFCDPENPLHYMTIWMTRAYLAKCRLMEYQPRRSILSPHQAEMERDTAISCALTMLECDTRIMTSPLTKAFLWLTHLYFPFMAYIQIAQLLKRQNINDETERAWDVMTANYNARLGFLRTNDGPFFQIFAQIIIQAWESQEIKLKELGGPLIAPRIVSSIRETLAQSAHSANANTPKIAAHMATNEILASVPIDFGNNSQVYGAERQDVRTSAELGAYSEIFGVAPLDIETYQLDWSAMDLDLANSVSNGTSQ